MSSAHCRAGQPQSTGYNLNYTMSIYLNMSFILLSSLSTIHPILYHLCIPFLHPHLPKIVKKLMQNYSGQCKGIGKAKTVKQRVCIQ